MGVFVGVAVIVEVAVGSVVGVGEGRGVLLGIGGAVELCSWVAVLVLSNGWDGEQAALSSITMDINTVSLSVRGSGNIDRLPIIGISRYTN